MVCADRADRVDIPRAAHAGYFRSERLGNLHRERPHASRRAIDQDLLPWLYLPHIAKSVEGGECGSRYGRRFLEREVGWLQCEGVCSGARILGTSTGAHAEHLIARLELFHIVANGLDLACHVVARTVFRFEQSSRNAHAERRASHTEAITYVKARRVNAYQHFIVFGRRLIDFLEFQNVVR